MQINLAPFTEDDFNLLISWFKSERELIQWAGPSLFMWPLNEKQLQHYLLRTNKTPPEALIYKSCMQHDNTTIGHIELDKIDWINKIGVLSRVIISPEYRGKGYSEKVVRAFLYNTFTALELNEIKLSVYSFNTPAIRCYENVGFETTDYIKNATKCGDDVWDVQFMKILRGQVFD